MKAVFSAIQLGHAPSRFLSKGHIVGYPESPDRARALIPGQEPRPSAPIPVAPRERQA